jgi:hypothetical protein
MSPSPATNVTQAGLAPVDFDWLRKLRGATDAKRVPPALPPAVADKLCQFGCIARDAQGGFAITDRGRGALLEQRMRDAEER